MSRPRLCECGSCRLCKARLRNRAAYQRMSVEERRTMVSARDPEKVRASDRRRYYRNKVKRLAAQAVYQKTPGGKAATAHAHKAWRARNPDKYKAQTIVGNAIRDGRLVKVPCEELSVDCKGPIQAHHDDYARPLDVRWKCRYHHEREHV